MDLLLGMMGATLSAVLFMLAILEAHRNKVEARVERIDRRLEAAGIPDVE